jgi:hypothetical protein
LLSNSGFELDGLHDLFADRDQVMFDLALHREGRRQKQGYLPPAQARAFLQMSRKLQLESDAMPPPNQIATAYFKGLGETKAGDPTSLDPLPAGSDTPSGPAAEAFSAVVDVLVEAGILTPPRALLSGSKLRETRLGLIQSLMQFLLDRDPASYSRRNEELTYLANSLMAGCSCQARPFTAQQASDAAIAVCNLGLENWPLHWLTAQATVLPDDFLVCHDLVTVFQIGWTILHDKVVLYAAKQLIESLTALRCDDREIQRGLDALRIKMTRHWKTGEPWRARSALEVIAILDMPAWASLLGLIDECPVIHAGMGAAQGLSKHSISPSAFDFISENRQIASVRDFMQSLPEILSR